MEGSSVGTIQVYVELGFLQRGSAKELESFEEKNHSPSTQQS